jgi:hypothetical protein
MNTPNPDSSDNKPDPFLEQLSQKLSALDEDRLRQICAEFGLTYDQLAGSDKGHKAESLVVGLSRNGGIRRLLKMHPELTPLAPVADTQGSGTTNGQSPGQGQTPTLGQIKEATSTWKDVFSSVLGLGAVLYAVGFVIASIYLLSFGISDFSLLKAKYIAGGLLFILLSAFAIYPAFFVCLNLLQKLSGLIPRLKFQPVRWLQDLPFIPVMLQFVPAAALPPFYKIALSIPDPDLLRTVLKNQSEIQKEANNFTNWLVSLLVLEVFVLFLLARPGLLISSSGTDMPFSLFLSGVGYLLLCWIFALILAVIASWKWKRTEVRNLYWAVVGVVLITLVLLPDYALQVYPQISPAFGGGQSATVKLVADDQSVDTLSQLVPMQPSLSGQPATSLSVELLDENDAAYFLLVPASVNPQPTPATYAVKVAKDLVQGIVYVTP